MSPFKSKPSSKAPSEYDGYEEDFEAYEEDFEEFEDVEPKLNPVCFAFYQESPGLKNNYLIGINRYKRRFKKRMNESL